MTSLPPYVIGIDPSLTATGIADALGRDLLTIHTDAKYGDERLDHIYRRIQDFTRATTPPELAVVEGLVEGQPSSGRSGTVQGVIRLALIRDRIPYAVVPPATLKKYATGKGNATKSDMRMALYQRAGIDERDDNRVDAYWLRQMGLAACGHPHAIDMPKVNRDVLLKVAWPEEIAARLLEPYEKAEVG